MICPCHIPPFPKQHGLCPWAHIGTYYPTYHWSSREINSVEVKQMFFQCFLLTKNKFFKKYWNLLGGKP
jgi:hypothetical protein